MQIQPLTAIHWPAVKAIYEQGIATGNATFQTTAPEWDEWDKAHVTRCRIVMEEGAQVLGWAALTPVSARSVYSGVAEVSVYVAPEAQGRGIGRLLLQQLIKESEHNHFWMLQASIFPENKASLKIHEQCGFTVLGVRERIGQWKGTWRDTIFVQRRSKTVGV